MTLHGGDDQRHAPRSTSKKAGERQHAEDFGPGARLLWSSPPTVRAGGARFTAPSSTAVVSFAISGAVFCRFEVDGHFGEPIEVERGQACKEDQR